ncbi:MAG: FecR domain-containing protein [Rhodoferax sp.]|nr:FecR domain-containing protein [Rhodoferax sp.]
MKQSFKFKNAALVMALAAIYPLYSHGAAGVTQFAVGDVNVRRGQAVTPLIRGQQISSGDQVITGRSGQTQLRFSDGGLVSLAPNSQFNIDRYADDNQPEDGFFASLLRGGMRAITGLVGKRNHDNYRISTSTATIGIRGSAFSANYNPDGSLNVAGEQDGIVVCTNAGCVELIVGEVVRVTGSDQLPQRTSARSNVPPMAVSQDLFVAENPAVIQLISIPEAQETLINGVLTGMSAMFAFGDGSIDRNPRGGTDPSSGSATFVDGQMVLHIGLSGNLQLAQQIGTVDTVEKTSAGSGTFGIVGTADDPALMGWGYWDTGRITYGSDGQVLAGNDFNYDQNHGVHYLVGRPAAQAQMPVTGTASYSLLGGTNPTAYDSELQILRIGTLNSAGLNVDFGMGRLNAFVNTTFAGPDGDVSVQISGYGYVSGSSFHSSQSGDGYEYNYDSGGAFYGFFAGSQATRAGMVYRGYDDSLGTVDGAAVFLKSGAGMAYSQQSGMSALFVSDDGYLFDYYPRGSDYYSPDASVGTGHFIGNELYLHDDGEDSNYGYGYGSAGYLAANSPVSSSGSIGNAGDSDFIGWGYWAKGTQGSNGSAYTNRTGVHYLAGRPTPGSDMPITGVATYTKVGGTAPTATLDGTTITGRLLDASLTVDFLIGRGTASISTDFAKNGATIPVLIQDSNIYLNGSTFCGSNVNGFFTGAQATRAGMIYQKNEGGVLGVVQGAVGLQRGGFTASPPPP